jgi:hypothetical protein
MLDPKATGNFARGSKIQRKLLIDVSDVSGGVQVEEHSAFDVRKEVTQSSVSALDKAMFVPDRGQVGVCEPGLVVGPFASTSTLVVPTLAFLFG